MYTKRFVKHWTDYITTIPLLQNIVMDSFEIHMKITCPWVKWKTFQTGLDCVKKKTYHPSFFHFHTTIIIILINVSYQDPLKVELIPVVWWRMQWQICGNMSKVGSEMVIQQSLHLFTNWQSYVSIRKQKSIIPAGKRTTKIFEPKESCVICTIKFCELYYVQDLEFCGKTKTFHLELNQYIT